MNKTAHILKNWLPVVFWLCCIFLLSTESFSAENTSRILEPLLRFLKPHITAREIDTIHFLIRKTAHVTEYCITSFLLFHSFHNTIQYKRYWWWVFYSLVIVMIVAATDEYHQSFVISRTSSIVDVGIDIAGGILGQGISIILYQFRRMREKSSDIR
jgi:VanZ family protein